VSKKPNKVIKNKVVNDSFCELEVLALNVCGLVSKLRNPDFREFISLNNNLSSIVNQKTQ
jgi:hypothetical protein